MRTSASVVAAPSPAAQHGCSGSEQELDRDDCEAREVNMACEASPADEEEDEDEDDAEDEDAEDEGEGEGAGSGADLPSMPVPLLLQPAGNSGSSLIWGSSPTARSMANAFRSAAVASVVPAEAPRGLAATRWTGAMGWRGAPCLSTEGCFTRCLHLRERKKTPQKPSPKAPTARAARSACKAPESPLSSSSSSIEAVVSTFSSGLGMSMCFDPGRTLSEVCTSPDEELFDDAISLALVVLASTPILLKFVMFGAVVVVETSRSVVNTASGPVVMVVVCVVAATVVKASGVDAGRTIDRLVVEVVRVVAATVVKISFEVGVDSGVVVAVVDTSGADVDTTSSPPGLVLVVVGDAAVVETDTGMR